MILSLVDVFCRMKHILMKYLLMKHLFLSLVVFSNTVSAQIPLTREPHHKIVFENGYVRVLDLRIAPGDTTLMHSHSAASVVVFLSTSSLVIRNVDGPAVVTPVKPGDMIYRAYDEKPVAHRVWTEDKAMFHCLVVEIKKRAVRDSCELVAGTGLVFQWDQKAVRAYRMRMPESPGRPGAPRPQERQGPQERGLPKSDCAWLTIEPAGRFAFFPPRAHAVARTGSVLLQLK
jgi:hypothetical protein